MVIELDTNKLITMGLSPDEYVFLLMSNSNASIQELKLNVYVTKPLLTHGRFEVKSFRDSGFIDFSGEYNYNSVIYNISANENIITANITANYFPRVL